MVSVFDNGRFAPCAAPFNLAAYVLAQAPRLADKPALVVMGRGGHAETWSYGALQAAVLGIASGLRARGLQRGDVVLMRLGNTVDFPLVYLAAIAAGFVPVPTSSMLLAQDVVRMVETLRPALVVRGAGVPCPEACGVPLVDEAELRRMRDLPAGAYDMGDPERLAYIIYTSGTSGQPRAVCHAHRAIWARRMMQRDWYDLHESDRLMHAGAFNWTYTLGTGLMDPWSLGATALIARDGTAPEELAGLMAEYEASIFAAAPGVYRKILKSGAPLDLPGLRHGLSAGEKLSEALREAWRAATGREVYEAYGMSECSTFISASPAHAAQAGTLGRPQDGRRLAILGEDGAPVPLGDTGVIAVDAHDPGLMLGYLGAPQETAAKYRGAWFLTGDLGSMAVDGQITYLGRADDMMNAGGYRVSPLEVEAVLARHPAIAEVGVIDVEIKPDVRVIAAFYIARSEVSEAELNAFASAHLARYKQPRVFVALDAMPLNPNGKILRRALRPIYEARHDQA